MIDENKKKKQDPTAIPVDCVTEGNDSEDDSNENDDVHVW